MKTANTKTRIYVGIFVLCVGIVAALCIIMLGDDLNLFKRSRTYNAHFANTAGLVAGAPVRMGGVEVGRVTKITIEPDGGAMAITAALRIDSPYFELLRSDASVGMDTQGLLGDKFITLNFGSSPTPLAEGAQIRVRAAEGIAKVVAKSEDILESINSTTKKIDAFTAGLPDAATSQAIINDFAQSAKLLHGLIEKMAAKDSLLSTLSDAEAKILLKNSLIKLESMASHADAIAAKVDAGQGTLGALINDRSLYEDLRSMLGHIDRGKAARRLFIEAVSKEAPKGSP